LISLKFGKIKLSPYFQEKNHVGIQSIAMVVFSAVDDGIAWLWKKILK